MAFHFLSIHHFCFPYLCEHIREPLNFGVFGFRRALLRFISSTCIDYRIAISQDNAAPFRFSGTKLSTIYNPVDINLPVESDLAELRRLYSVHSQERILFFPGGSVLKAKGLFVFLYSLHLLLQEKTYDFSVRALIPGLILNPRKTDKDRAYANHLIALYNLEPYIIVLLLLRCLLYYSISSLVISPLHPHFRALIESFAFGVPDSTDSSINREIISNGFNGNYSTVTPMHFPIQSRIF